MAKRLYAIAYDIPDDNRRVKLANLLKSYGERVQLSVFECYLDERMLRDLLGRAKKIVNLSEDSLRLYPVEGEVRIVGLGAPTRHKVAPSGLTEAFAVV